MKITILGCGTSSGVPQLDNGWGQCDPNNPKNYRMRCSAYIETTNKNGDDVAFLVDTGPDLRAQILQHNIQKIDAILYTHPHSDHLHGIDEIRWVNMMMNQDMPAYMDENTHKNLAERFSYCLDGKALIRDDGSRFYGRPVLECHVLDYNQNVTVEGVDMTTIYMDHGLTDAMGWRIGDFAYCTDVWQFSDESFDLLHGVQYWVIDCLREREHPTHAHLDRVLDWVDKLKPKQVYLTHLNNEMDYEIINNKTPQNVEPAYDGLIIYA